MMTMQDCMFSYVGARGAGVALGTLERAGLYLLTSARGTPDGEPCVGEAVAAALESGDVDAAIEIADRFLELSEVTSPAVRGNGNFAASGEIRRAR